MTDEALTELRELRRDVSTLMRALSPWIGMDEMMARYDVCGATLRAMERRHEIPPRINGRWLRATVIELESAP